MQSQSPELLLFYGINPSQIDILEEQLITYEETLSESVCDRSARFTGIWRQWLGKYRERLSKEALGKERELKMNEINPKFILRNHILQKSIESAEKGEFSEVNKLLELCQNPYGSEEEEFYYTPAKHGKIKVSCSS